MTCQTGTRLRIEKLETKNGTLEIMHWVEIEMSVKLIDTLIVKTKQGVK